MNKLEALVNVLLRCVFGGIGFFAVNSILQYIGIQVLVGINGKTLATVGILGFPGFLLLYAILFCHLGYPHLTK
jgi:inhibitor of the pro-sigma K processing machinery